MPQSAPPIDFSRLEALSSSLPPPLQKPLSRLLSLTGRRDNQAPPLPPRRPFPLLRLPPELLLHTLTFVPLPTLLAVLTLNREIYTLLKENETGFVSRHLSQSPAAELLRLFPPPSGITTNSFLCLSWLASQNSLCTRLAYYLAHRNTGEGTGVTRQHRVEADTHLVGIFTPLACVLHSQLRGNTKVSELNTNEMIQLWHLYTLVRTTVSRALGQSSPTSMALLCAILRGGVPEIVRFFDVDSPGSNVKARKRWMERMAERVQQTRGDERRPKWEDEVGREMARRGVGGQTGHMGFARGWFWGDGEVRLACDWCLDA